MRPGGRGGIDRQRLEDDNPKDPIEIGGEQRIQDVP
jgi:hypothetical protein